MTPENQLPLPSPDRLRLPFVFVPPGPDGDQLEVARRAGWLRIPARLRLWAPPASAQSAPEASQVHASLG